jgi:tRNA nucleotidyltransferase (CCA-adding enzyme)
MTHTQERIAICIAKIIQQHPQVKNIFDEIYQQGGRVLLVGGAVRDCLLGCLSSDLDFEVYHLSFEELEDILKKFGKVSFVGKSFGVLRLHGFDADWSIPRSDSMGRKPNVSLDPDMSFAQAFRRRDVTMNAMGIDVSSMELIDPYDGANDLQKKTLRSPDVAFFVQDPLRLFRVMQFVARFDMHVDEQLSQACQNMDISEVSVQRIEQEFAKLFTKANQPSKGFIWLEHIKRVADILPGIILDQQFYQRLDAIAESNSFDYAQRISVSFALLAYQVQSDLLKSIDIHKKITRDQFELLSDFLKKFTTSTELSEKSALIGFYVRYVPFMIKQDAQAFKWLAHWIEPYFAMQFLGDVAACWYTPEVVEQFVRAAKNAKVLHHAELPVLAGQDLINIAQGKELGELIKRAYEIQIKDSISDKQKLLKKIVGI